jgi:hypothetical protein
MTTVKANAHVNELTKGVKNDFYLTPNLGEWRVKVATQFTSNASQFTKDVREYEYPNIVTVL